MLLSALISWHDWHEKRHSDSLIDVSISRCFDPIGARYIPLCCELIGARYVPLCSDLIGVRGRKLENSSQEVPGTIMVPNFSYDSEMAATFGLWIQICVCVVHNWAIFAINGWRRSLHSDGIKEVHQVPMNVINRPIPSVLEEEKVQSLIKTIQVRVF